MTLCTNLSVIPLDHGEYGEVFSFGQNRIQTALNWEYLGGTLLEYHYEKQRLLLHDFPDLTDFDFITFTLLGLTEEMRKCCKNVSKKLIQKKIYVKL